MSFTIRRLKEEPQRKRFTFPWKGAAVAALGLAGSVLSFRKWRQHEEEVHIIHRKLMLKRIFLIVLALLLVLILFAGTVKALTSLRIITLDSVVEFTGTPPPVDANGQTNILLLGQGNEEHDGKDLTDTIIIASIETDHPGSVVLLSLPRDLYFLKTEKMGKGKLNSFYRDYKNWLWLNQGMEQEDAEVEAIRELKDEVGRKLGLTMHHAVKVDFEGFIEVVDIIGGVEVDVPEDIVDTQYPNETFGYEPFSISAGRQMLDGETALKYARSRSTTSDFDRSARQQQILSALADKAKRSGFASDPGKIVEMVRSLSKHVLTTMSLSEMIGMADMARSLDRSNIITMQLNDRNALFDGFIEPGGFLYTPPRDLFEGASVLLPISTPEFPITWDKIQLLVRMLTGHRQLYLDNPSLAVLNSTAPSGTARRLATELIRYGFDVPIIENAESGDQDEATISATAPNTVEYAAYFADLLQLKQQTVPAGLPVEQQQPITIILARDYSFQPLERIVRSAQ